MSQIEEIVLGVEELEALRLAHMESFYQHEAAERMQVSRATFGRTLDVAHRKVTQALVKGCALRIEGGAFQLSHESQAPHCHQEATPSPEGGLS